MCCLIDLAVKDQIFVPSNPLRPRQKDIERAKPDPHNQLTSNYTVVVDSAPKSNSD